MVAGRDDELRSRDFSLTRRGALKAAAGTGLILGSGTAINNVVLGYDSITGTNLLEQDLTPLAKEYFWIVSQTLRVGEYRISVDPPLVVLTDSAGEQIDFYHVGPGHQPEATDRDHELGLGGVLAELVSDLSAINNEEYTFEFTTVPEFLDRVEQTEPRPYTTGSVRGWESTAPEYVREFTGADPTDPPAILTGLVTGFREHTHYDIPRYIAGSIQDNVIFGARDLRAPLETETDFETVLSSDASIGMFCYDFTHRSIEALHAIPAFEQTIPVVGAKVYDRRHKHVYTAIASVVRDNQSLRIPMTFVDYTHTTIYDDLRVRSVLGEGFNAYDSRHRATAIYWTRFY